MLGLVLALVSLLVAFVSCFGYVIVTRRILKESEGPTIEKLGGYRDDD